MWYVVVAVVFFVGGWAFFKHRAKIKAEAGELAASAKQAATAEAEKAESYVKSKL